MALNMRNSTLSKHSAEYLTRCLNHTEYYLTSLNLKFCFLSFEHIQLLSNALRSNKTLVKLDLSKNGLKSYTAKYFLDALQINEHLMNINFHGNLLDDDFAYDLAKILSQNSILHTVDISNNPIGPEGAQSVLNVLLQ
jgi:Ran GTPase-activating protein (RanGAP) involved in mRNA processing and transport